MMEFRRLTLAGVLLLAAGLAGAQSLAPMPADPGAPEATEQPTPPPPPAAPRREDATWTATLERIAQSVVAIEIDATRDGDARLRIGADLVVFEGIGPEALQPRDFDF